MIQTQKSNICTWFKEIPKIELHIHLEGTIPIESLFALINKYGGDPRFIDRDSLAQFFQYRDFQHFLDLWVWKNGFLREYEDFTFISEAVASRLKDDNIRYAEMFFAPARFWQVGLQTQYLIESIKKGFDAVPDIHINLIPDLVRDLGAKVAKRVVEEIGELKDMNVLGIGMGGAEHLHPPSGFQNVYKLARQLGLQTTVHAGEASGAQSVWDAINLLNVNRIGHGTRAFEDENLISELKSRQIPLEMCPLSNVATGIVSSIKEHPIRSFFDKGLMVTLNSDDPLMFNNSLSTEFEALHQFHHFKKDEFRLLTLNAINSSWLNNDEKKDLERKVFSETIWENPIS